MTHRPRGLIGRVLFFAAGFLLAGAVAALAYWVVTVIMGSGNYALAQANSLSAPTNATVAEASSTSVTIGWSLPASQLPGAQYEVIRNPGGSQVTVCTVTAPTCTDSNLSPGTTYNYSVIAVLGTNWQSTAATTSFTALGVTTSSLPDASYGTSYSTTLAATGGSGTYTTWALSAGTLPSWAHLNASTGAITGTPDTTGTTTGLQFTVTDSNTYTATSGSLSLTVAQAILTVTASNTSTPYGSVPTVTADYSGFQNSDGPGSLTTQPTCSSTVIATTGVGTYGTANSCIGGLSTNYAFSYVSGNATVTRATVTIMASATSTTYGSVPTVTADYSGFQNSQDSSALTSQPTCSSTVTETSDVGSYTGANTCVGAAATNYAFTYVAGNATVIQATVTITASDSSTTYGSTPAPSSSYSGFQNSQNSSVLSPKPTCSSTVTATTNVGSYTGANTCVGAAATNYTFTYVAGNATVTQATVTITASDTLTPAGINPNVSASFSGFKNGQTPSVLTSQPTCSSTVTATTSVGSYTGVNTCVAAAATNYTFTYVAGNATVTQASPTLSTSGPSGDIPGVAISASSISATLADSSGSNASGTIDFTVFGPGSEPGTCTAGTAVGTATVSGNGTYYPSAGFTPTGAGDYWWYAYYSGDSNNNVAISPCGSGMSKTDVEEGNWVGTYGSSGYILGGWNTDQTYPPDANSSDLSYLPSGITYGASFAPGTVATRYQWANPTTDTRALESPDDSYREATCWYDNSSFTLTLTLSFSSTFSGNLELYAVDWDSKGRNETITVTDSYGSYPVTIGPFVNGAWVLLPINVKAGGSVTINVAHNAGDNAVLSGVFLN
jgi:hypothetical protein